MTSATLPSSISPWKRYSVARSLIQPGMVNVPRTLLEVGVFGGKTFIKSVLALEFLMYISNIA